MRPDGDHHRAVNDALPSPSKPDAASDAGEMPSVAHRPPTRATPPRPRVIIIGALAAALALTACESPPTQQQAGTVVGGVLGGVLGSQVGRGSGRTAATVIGTLIGASIGGAVGRSMDDNDRRKTAQALETVRTGQSSTWTNPDSGASYTVTPTRTRTTAKGPCREYTTRAVIGGKTETVYGQACRQADGSWRVVP
jgi:surface antigen